MIKPAQLHYKSGLLNYSGRDGGATSCTNTTIPETFSVFASLAENKFSSPIIRVVMAK
jgi:hypothetical protein